MRRKVIFLISFVILAIAVIALVRFLSTRGPKTGELRVDSNPAVTVFINGKNAGVSPYKEKVDTGTYIVKLIPQSATDQIIPWEGNVTIGQNLLTFINANLSQAELTNAVDVIWLEKITSKLSELSVTTNPDGATVLVDDVTRGVTPLTLQDITAGEHTVSIISSGFQTRKLSIRTTPGHRLYADFKLALASGSTTVPGTGDATPAGSLQPDRKTSTTSASNTVVPAKPYVVIKDTPIGFLRVRSEPSTTATESGRVNPQEKYTILDSQNGWYQIRYDDINTGWISGQYADKVE